MNKQEQIDWLARNVSEWPIKPEGGFIPGSYYYGPEQKEIVHCNGGIAKHQWQSRRSELINKPLWADAPEWAKYLCQTSIGKWYWCESDQKINKYGGWDVIESNLSDKIEYAQSGEPLDWKSSLEKRPENNVKEEEFKPTHTVTAKDQSVVFDCVIRYKSDQHIIIFDGENEYGYAPTYVTVTPYKSRQQKQFDIMLEKWKRQSVDCAHDNRDSPAAIGYVFDWVIDNYEIKEK